MNKNGVKQYLQDRRKTETENFDLAFGCLEWFRLCSWTVQLVRFYSWPVWRIRVWIFEFVGSEFLWFGMCRVGVVNELELYDVVVMCLWLFRNSSGKIHVHQYSSFLQFWSWIWERERNLGFLKNVCGCQSLGVLFLTHE